MNITEFIQLANYAFVLFFGITVALYLADAPFFAHKKLYILSLLGFGMAQIIFYFLFDEDILYKCYPLLIHLPLILLIRFVLHRNTYISVIAVLSAYLFCTPRKWFGTFVSSFFDYDPMIANLASLIITIPLLFIVIRFISPYIIRLKYESKTTLLLFFLLPMFYYILEYTFTVYTNLLYTGNAVVVEFVDSSVVLLYFVFATLSLKFSSEKANAERSNMMLTNIALQAQKEIAQLSNSEKQASIYRHDLRHHLNYIQQCIIENKTDDALDYIHEISDTLENSKVTRYCQNESINLIISSYAEQAASQHITTEISITATDFSRFQIMDLCGLLANAMENAIHACMQMNGSSTPYIHLKIYEKSNHLCINMANSYGIEPHFENKIPISKNRNHGIGVSSMISVVEKYHGVYGFSAYHGEFRFQVSM